MKLFLKNIAIFSIYSFIVYLLLLCLCGTPFIPKILKPNLNYNIGGYGHFYSRLAEIKNVSDIDILFTGSSHAYRGFDPRIFKANGYTTFSMGSSAQTPIQTKCLLNRYLKNVNPKLIIYEVYPVTFTIDGVESAIDLISNDKNDLNSLQMLFELKSIKTFNTYIYASMVSILWINKNFKESYEKQDDTYISCGFVEKQLTFYKNEPYIPKRLVFNRRQFDIFLQIIQMLNSYNIPVILVQTPVTKNYYKSFLNNDEFDNTISKYSKYYNFNKIMDLNDSTDFFDSDHLNQNGVRKFNEYLLNIIKNEYSGNLYESFIR
jgi:hypothetical protein